MANMISIATLFDLLKTKVGWQKPNHKYLYRIPLGGGGYKYFYHNAEPQKFSEAESKEFDKDPEFVSEQDKAVDEFINFASNPVAVAKHVKDIDYNFNSVYGPMWEIFAAIPNVKDFNDSMMKTRHLLDEYKDEHHQKVLRGFVDRVAAFRKTKNDFHLERMVHDNQVQWKFLDSVSSLSDVDFKYFRLLSSAHVQGGDRVADLTVIDAQEDKNNDLGILMMDLNSGKVGAMGLSQKSFGAAPITLKSNGIGVVTARFTAAADRLIKAGSSKAGNALKSWSAKMQQTYDSANDEAKYLSYHFPEHKKLRADIEKYKKFGAAKFEKWIKGKMPEVSSMTSGQLDTYSKYRKAIKRLRADVYTFRMRKLEKVFSDALKDADFKEGFSDELYDIYSGAFHDSHVSELVMVMPHYDEKEQKSSIYIARESKLNKKLKKLLSPGNFEIEMKNLGKKQVIGKSLDSFYHITISANVNNRPTKIGLLRFREDEGKFYTMVDPKFMLEFAKSNNEVDAVDVELEKRGHNKTVKSIIDDLIKATQTLDRKKMNAKYIRKELTESGNVRYIYKETNPRTKKEEDVPTDNRDKFLSSVDSVDAAFKTLFGEAVSEIDDAHFVCINAGCVSTRITKEIELLHDALDVPEKLRSQFSSAAGLINSVNGKMGFCIANFPEDVSDMVRKAAMMHEMGHAYFYGALRIKHKQPLTADTIDSKDKEQKDSLKKATKFVDAFGKIDDDIRKQAEESVVDVKGQDKETMLQEAISAYMVSPYAAETSEEHFAEAFSRYFILPEQLKKKEEAVYKHFNEFFGKYDGD